MDLERAEPARDLARLFQNAHEYGTRALRARDLKGFSHAIAVERDLIDEQRAILEERRDAIKKQREVISGIRQPNRKRTQRSR